MFFIRKRIYNLHIRFFLFYFAPILKSYRMATRLDFINNSNILLKNVELYRDLEDSIYNLLKGKNVNTALIVESLGMQRQTAYLKLRKRTFKTDELIQIANKAVEIYKIDF